MYVSQDSMWWKNLEFFWFLRWTKQGLISTYVLVYKLSSPKKQESYFLREEKPLDFAQLNQSMIFGTGMAIAWIR